MMNKAFCVCITYLCILLCNEVSASCTTQYPTTVTPMLPTFLNKSQVFKFGVLGTFGPVYKNMWSAISFAVNIINTDPILLPDVLIEAHVTEVSRTDANALQAAQSLIDNSQVKAIIGGATSAETKVSQLVSRINNVPQVIALAISTTFSNKNEYPFLARVIPNDFIQAAAIADLIKINGWKQFMLVYSDDEYGNNGLENIHNAVRDLNVTVYSTQIKTGTQDFSGTIETIKRNMEINRVRVFVLYFLITESNYFLPQMRTAGLMGPSKYVYIYSYTLTAYYIGYNITANPWANGAIGLMPRLGYGDKYFKEYLPKYNAMRDANNTFVRSLDANWYYFDTVLTIATALKDVLSAGFTLNTMNGTNLMDAIKKVSLTGVTGNISLDSNLDRRGEFQWLNFGLNQSQNPIPVAMYSDISESTTIVKPFTYYGGATTVSDGACSCFHGECNENDVCVCSEGYSGSTCSTLIVGGGLSTRDIVLIAVFPAVALVALVFGVIRYNRYKRVRMIKDVTERQRSNIDRDDITLHQAIGRGAAGVVFKGVLRGSEVAVKRLMADATSADIVDEFELESAIMAGLRHPNIVLFMGSCFVPETKEMLLVMEFMEKGSLNDVLNNNKISLPFELVLHIALHAAKGMCFLHQSSPPIIHRDLKSHNILLDDKWNARISDFGITRIKNLNNKKNTKQHIKSMGTIYWTAPEVFEGHEHTEKSDCYSFGIVMWELVYRRIPYAGREPMAVALEVARSQLRPSIDNNIDATYKELMMECWAHNPDDRPDFDRIMQRLRAMSGQHPVVNFGSQDSRVDAPSGRATFVLTEIMGAENMWDSLPKEMLTAVSLHNNLVHTTVEHFNGYEVEFTGTGFILVFENLKDAMNWCISTQNTLMNLPWPKKLLENSMASVEISSSGKRIWGGLRVKMAIHSGVANSSVDILTGRTKYFGPVVDRVGKIMNSVSTKGSIFASAAVVEQINTSQTKFLEEVEVKSVGEIPDTSRSKTESIYRITPNSLLDRMQFIPTLDDVNLPHSVLDIDEETPMAPPQYKPTWSIPSSELTIFESVGKGAIGDFHRASWNGKEVVKKSLINQKLDEMDILNLKSRTCLLSKISHKNLLEVYGTCFEAGNIGLVCAYVPNGQLRAILSNSSIALSPANKLWIAREVAEGMLALSKNPDPDISVHGNLKSGNILVNLDKREVKVTDYGQGNLKDLARTMTSVGTVAWTAPELLSGEEATSAISVYSYGIILFEIYTRLMPYQDEHPVKLVAKVMSGHRPALPNNCPPSFAKLVSKCLSGDPLMRPSWQEICMELDNITLS